MKGLARVVEAGRYWVKIEAEEWFVGECFEVDGRIGEIIAGSGNTAVGRLFWPSTGIAAGEEVKLLKKPLEVILSPFLLGRTLDGFGRELGGEFSLKGFRMAEPEELLPRRAKFTPKEVNFVEKFGVIGDVEVQGKNFPVISPYSGEVEDIKAGLINPLEPVARVAGRDVFVYLRWPVRKPLVKVKKKYGRVLPTGIKTVDFLFPIIAGSSTVVSGGFGTGKTMLLHKIFHNAPVAVKIFVGCGERGNEMAELIEEMQGASSPVVLVANTSNMPVTARELSAVLGRLIAQYFLLLGKDALLVVDSMSRWAEALRELYLSLGILPAEEGYPPEVFATIKAFVASSGAYNGSYFTLVASTSPPQNDLTEPVTQAAVSAAENFLGLSRALADRRFYPAIDLHASFSKLVALAEKELLATIPEYSSVRKRFLDLIFNAEKTEEIAKVFGYKTLELSKKRLLLALKAVRKAILYQNFLLEPHVPFDKLSILVDAFMFFLEDLESFDEEKIDYYSKLFDEKPEETLVGFLGEENESV